MNSNSLSPPVKISQIQNQNSKSKFKSCYEIKFKFKIILPKKIILTSAIKDFTDYKNHTTIAVKWKKKQLLAIICSYKPWLKLVPSKTSNSILNSKVHKSTNKSKLFKLSHFGNYRILENYLNICKLSHFGKFLYYCAHSTNTATL